MIRLALDGTPLLGPRSGIGEVVASRCDAFAVGDVITTLTGFQEYVIIRDDVFSTPVPGRAAVDQLAVMSVYGPTGATAYIGMTDIGRGLGQGRDVLHAAPGKDAWILLFTDGKPQTTHSANPVETMSPTIGIRPTIPSTP